MGGLIKLSSVSEQAAQAMEEPCSLAPWPLTLQSASGKGRTEVQLEHGYGSMTTDIFRPV